MINYCMCVLQIFVACDKDSSTGIKPVNRVEVKYKTIIHYLCVPVYTESVFWSMGVTELSVSMAPM